MNRVIANVGGFSFPVGAMGIAIWAWLYDATGSVNWAAVGAIGFIIVNLVGLGAIYGVFSKRMDNLESNIPLHIENAILKLKNELRDIYQTRDACDDNHSNGRSAAAGGK